jgi:hypothetical protein
MGTYFNKFLVDRAGGIRSSNGCDVEGSDLIERQFLGVPAGRAFRVFLLPASIFAPPALLCAVPAGGVTTVLQKRP